MAVGVPCIVATTWAVGVATGGLVFAWDGTGDGVLVGKTVGADVSAEIDVDTAVGVIFVCAIPTLAAGSASLPELGNNRRPRFAITWDRANWSTALVEPGPVLVCVTSGVASGVASANCTERTSGVLVACDVVDGSTVC